MIVFIVDLNLMPSVKFRAAMSESKSICGPLYIDFNSDWFALWFLRIKYVRKGNSLCWTVEFLDLAIFLHKGNFHILCQILGMDHRSQNYLRAFAHNFVLYQRNFFDTIYRIVSSRSTSWLVTPHVTNWDKFS